MLGGKLNDSERTFTSMGGLEPNTVLGTKTIPGFWLFNAANATTGTRPTDKTYQTDPCWTAKISLARGCVCGAIVPFTAKSARANDSPRVFSPGRVSAVTSSTPVLVGLFTGCAF
ncbi:unnamed protein product [Cochlearia groenlandica]